MPSRARLPIPAGWAAGLLGIRWMVRAPVFVFRARLGFVFGSRLLMLEHVGRKSGVRRYAVLETVGRADPGTYIVAAGFGDHCQWLRNVRANPRVRVSVGRRSAVPAMARVLNDKEAAAALAAYRRRHPRAWAALRPVFERTTGSPIGSDATGLRLVALQLDRRGWAPATGTGTRPRLGLQGDGAVRGDPVLISRGLDQQRQRGGDGGLVGRGELGHDPGQLPFAPGVGGGDQFPSAGAEREGDHAAVRRVGAAGDVPGRDHPVRQPGHGRRVEAERPRGPARGHRPQVRQHGQQPELRQGHGRVEHVEAAGAPPRPALASPPAAPPGFPARARVRSRPTSVTFSWPPTSTLTVLRLRPQRSIVCTKYFMMQDINWPYEIAAPARLGR